MTTPKPKQGTGDIATFNIHHGFAEALVRGMRSSFLQDQDYHHLTQCETLDDVRLNLTETDYADALADFNSLTPNILQKAAVEKVGRTYDTVFSGGQVME
jgi:V-type H+-transporting ATPase subunit d